MAAGTQPGVRVLIAQWQGDYREAWKKLEAGGGEDYYAQRYSVTSAATLASRCGALAVLNMIGPTAHDEMLENGVRAMSLGASQPDFDRRELINLVSRFEPTHLVVTTPQVELLEWALSRGIALLPMFADTFQKNRGGNVLRRLVRAWRHEARMDQLVGALTDSRVRWVSNHNIVASQMLVDLGVDAKKVIPWDWPPVVRPSESAPKRLARAGRLPRLVFIGSLMDSKGVFDAVAAVATLRKRGRATTLRVIGRGDLAPLQKLVRSLDVVDLVALDGPRSHSEVIKALHEADLSLVPSWHAYPEGLPMTIYESFATRTPLVCSDHPAFRDRVSDGHASLVVPERSPDAIADAVLRIVSDADLYADMSAATEKAWNALVCPVRYFDLIERWALGGADDDAWLASHSLAARAARGDP